MQNLFYFFTPFIINIHWQIIDIINLPWRKPKKSLFMHEIINYNVYMKYYTPFQIENIFIYAQTISDEKTLDCKNLNLI